MARKLRPAHASFLNDLRDSGVTNMYGAAPYLADEFSLSREESRSVLMAWMDSFKHEAR